MGHVRLGVLPHSKKWHRVVEDLRLGVDVGSIATAAAEAAESSLQNATSDEAFLQSFWLLTQLPLAARSSSFVDDVRGLGLQIGDAPNLMDIIAAFSAAIDQHSRRYGGRTDFGEMAQMAAVESITSLVGSSLPSLFEPNSEEVQHAIGRFAAGDRFSTLAREFFARLTLRTLDYYLSRELSNHVGPGKRFRDDIERREFDASLDRHCRQASRIVEEFSAGWYGKNVYSRAGLTQDAVRRFAAVAFKKLRDELRKRRDADA
jgi:hypothetical protein